MQGMVLEENIVAYGRQQYACLVTLAMVSVLPLTRLRMHWFNSYDVTVTDMSLFSGHKSQQNNIGQTKRSFRGYLPP